jgi:predicted membrane protein
VVSPPSVACRISPMPPPQTSGAFVKMARSELYKELLQKNGLRDLSIGVNFRAPKIVFFEYHRYIVRKSQINYAFIKKLIITLCYFVTKA